MPASHVKMSVLFEIADAIEGRTGVDGSFSTPMPRVFLLRSSEPSAPIQTVYEPSICFVVQGEKQVECGHYRLLYEPGATLAVASPLPVVGQVIQASKEAPFLAVRLELDLDLLRGFLPTPRSAVKGKPAHEGLTIFQPPSGLADAILRLVRFLDNPAEVKVLGPLVELEILYLLSKCAPTLERLATPETTTARTSWVANYLRCHWREGLPLHMLANRVQMTEQRLRSNFLRLTGREPAAFQKLVRLQEARRLLSLGAPPSIAASSTGFANGSAFEVEYQAVFDSTPTTDAVRLRQLSPGRLEE